MVRVGSDSFRELLTHCPEHISAKATIKKVKAGEIVFSQGEPAPYFCILLEGNLKSYHSSSLGTKYMVLIQNPGDIMGEIEILEGRPCICTVEALKDSLIFSLPRDLYRQWLQEDIDFSMYIHRQLCDKVYLLAKKMPEDILYPLKYRLLNLIKYLIKEKNASGINSFRLSKDELAEELGVTLRTVNRSIKELKAKGILDYNRGYLQILSAQLLLEEIDRF